MHTSSRQATESELTDAERSEVLDYIDGPFDEGLWAVLVRMKARAYATGANDAAIALIEGQQ